MFLLRKMVDTNRWNENEQLLCTTSHNFTAHPLTKRLETTSNLKRQFWKLFAIIIIRRSFFLTARKFRHISSNYCVSDRISWPHSPFCLTYHGLFRPDNDKISSISGFSLWAVHLVFLFWFNLWCFTFLTWFPAAALGLDMCLHFRIMESLYVH